ncbi:MAG: hypothetical protein HKO02_07360 [Hyphomonadaceae bacterium]|nr:hypothetical protein [Hyphomonadaceae bacterium]
MKAVQLLHDDWDVRIDPDDGGLFDTCSFGQYEIFRDRVTADVTGNTFAPMLSGNFPLHPYSNRIKHGRFEFQGRSVQLVKTAPHVAHPLHGLGWINPWHVHERGNDYCVLTQRIDGDGWPWVYEAALNISVIKQVLRLELHLTNKSALDMPCGFGFHPYFPDLETAFICFNSSGVWLCDDEHIPTEWSPTSPEFDFSKPRELKNLSLDHCFTETRNAEISWQDKPIKINITSSENLSRAAVFVDQPNDRFCFEPISHTHNALNMAAPVSEGITILRPGKSASCWSEFTVEI